MKTPRNRVLTENDSDDDSDDDIQLNDIKTSMKASLVKPEKEENDNSSVKVSMTPIRSRKNSRKRTRDEMNETTVSATTNSSQSSSYVKKEENDSEDEQKVVIENDDSSGEESAYNGESESENEEEYVNKKKIIEDDDMSDGEFDFKPDNDKKKTPTKKKGKKVIKEESLEEEPAAKKKKTNDKKAKKVKKETKKESKKKDKKKKDTKKKGKGKKVVDDDNDDDEEEEEEVYKWWVEESFEEIRKRKKSTKWKTLVWNGVMFPPEYKPHNKKVLYKEKPVDLTPEQEEIATMYAVLREFDYYSDEVFKKNFFNSWKKLLGKNHEIKNLKDCNFNNIWKWHLKEKEKKANMTKEEKLKERKKRQEEDGPYMYAMIDGRKEKISSFKVEPPGLFRGRGAHPKRGMLKERVKPNDVTINIGKKKDAPKPPKGYKWKDIISNPDVTWLASYKNNMGEVKYVMLDRSSSFKGRSDYLKFEIARKLKDKIDLIRKTYREDWANKDKNPQKRQLAVALYFIDKLALRNGGEKGEDEADTVGCTSLRVEHIKLEDDNHITLDFLGKDSIRYTNTVEIEPKAYKNLKDFIKGKKKEEQLFDKIDASTLNTYTKQFYADLSAKVFRTYNASYTLQQELEKIEKKLKKLNQTEKEQLYNNANREVAILCNHQRAAAKTFDSSLKNVETKIKFEEDHLKDLKKASKDSKIKDYNDLKNKSLENFEKRLKKWEKDVKKQESDHEKAKKQAQKENKSLPRAPPKLPKPPKRVLPPKADDLSKKIEQVTARIRDMKVKKQMKEDNKTVSLSTSKINYIDPRISVAWCKRHDVPISRIFSKSNRTNFNWAMDVDKDWKF